MIDRIVNTLRAAARLRALWCRHGTVRVVRCHSNVVPDDWRYKLLYVDRYKVHNFVQCVHCDKVLETDQQEHLYDDAKGLPECKVTVCSVGLCGSMAVMVDDFEYVRVNYRYPYTDNLTRYTLTHDIAAVIKGEKVFAALPQQVQQQEYAAPQQVQQKGGGSMSAERWIAVTDRLPKGEDAVSCEAWCAEVEEGMLAGPCVMAYDEAEGEWQPREDTGCWEPGEVTHWRPRPKGPEALAHAGSKP